MNELPEEILKFHRQQAYLAEQTAILDQLRKVIIDLYCPLKKGDKVIYNEWWRNNDKKYYGIIRNINFDGFDERAIDNKWRLQVQPTTKEFKEIKGSFNMYDKDLGVHKKDKIEKYE